MAIVRTALGSTTGQKTELKMFLSLQKKKLTFQWSISLSKKAHKEEQPMYFIETVISHHWTFCESFTTAAGRRGETDIFKRVNTLKLD